MVGLQVKAPSFFIVLNWFSDYLISALPQPIFNSAIAKLNLRTSLLKPDIYSSTSLTKYLVDNLVTNWFLIIQIVKKL